MIFRIGGDPKRVIRGQAMNASLFERNGEQQLFAKSYLSLRYSI